MSDTGRMMKYAENVSKLIQIDTVRRPGKDDAQFLKFHALLENMFPQVHQHCKKWKFENSLLFCWKGRERKSMVLMSHQDVVDAKGEWKYPPFSGTIAEGKLWGRGAYDIKGNLHSILQAVEELIEEGFEPAWDIYIVSSHEEEPGGNDLISDFMKQEGIRPEFIVDEGGTVQPCPAWNIPQKFTAVAVAEKGYMDVRFTAKGKGGHSSAPKKGSPLARLAALICTIEENELFPVRLDKASAEMYRRVAARAEAPDVAEILWSIAQEQEGWQSRLDEKGYAKLHTTIAFTMAEGSGAPNVIPNEAHIVCNIRISPGDTIEEVLRKLKKIADPLEVNVEMLKGNEASTITDPDGEAFRKVEQAARMVWPQYEVIPVLLSGCTDTRHFMGVCPNCLRFTALSVSAQQMAAVHGVDENIDISTLPEGVDFFKTLIRIL